MDWNRNPPLAPPLVPGSVFRLRDLDHLEAVYSGAELGFVYARDGHPNARSLEAKLAALERAEEALVVSSGMAAIALSLLGSLQPGDTVVAGMGLYGKTQALLKSGLEPLGVRVELCDFDRAQAFDELVELRPKLVLVESLSNPLLRAAPIDVIAKAAHDLGATVAVDATFTPPPMLRPLELGADLVIHSLTKFLSGHGDVTLGAIAGNSALVSKLRPRASMWGWHAAAFDCWTTERGLETLSVRWDRAADNARRLGELLRNESAVTCVHDPNDPQHPDADWLRRHARTGGTMLAFDLAGGRDAVNRWFQALQHVAFCPSLGDVRTTVSYPWRTSHIALSDFEKLELGVTPGTVRVSVGIEEFDVIAADVRRAFAQIGECG